MHIKIIMNKIKKIQSFVKVFLLIQALQVAYKVLADKMNSYESMKIRRYESKRSLLYEPGNFIPGESERERSRSSYIGSKLLCKIPLIPHLAVHTKLLAVEVGDIAKLHRKEKMVQITSRGILA